MDDANANVVAAVRMVDLRNDNDAVVGSDGFSLLSDEDEAGLRDACRLVNLVV